jgi:hypothetical protein
MSVFLASLAGYMDLNILAVAATAIFVVRAEPLLKVSPPYSTQ